VPNSVKCVATLLHSVCLHCAVLDELHVRNGILSLLEYRMTARTGEIVKHNEWIQDLLLTPVVKGLL